MTAPLGSDICPRLGCGRHRHVSPSGIHYGTCLAHAGELLSRAFRHDSPPSAPSSLPPAGRRIRQAVVA